MLEDVRNELEEKDGVTIDGILSASGGAAIIYAGNFNGRRCVFKISKEPIDTPDSLSAKEAASLPEIAEHTTHPNIIELFSSWIIQGHLVTVWARADMDLGKRLNDCKASGQAGIPKGELLRYMRQAAEGLDYINNLAIYHRDLKPTNVLLFKDHAMLADLGLAKYVGETSSALTASVVGTPGYLPPETLGDKPKLHKTSDLYSLAVMYAELRTGYHPFKDAPSRTKPILTGLDDQEEVAVRRALQTDPRRRPPDGAVAWVESLKPKPRQAPDAEPTRKRIRWGLLTPCVLQLLWLLTGGLLVPWDADVFLPWFGIVLAPLSAWCLIGSLTSRAQKEDHSAIRVSGVLGLVLSWGAWVAASQGLSWGALSDGLLIWDDTVTHWLVCVPHCISLLILFVPLAVIQVIAIERLMHHTRWWTTRFRYGFYGATTLLAVIAFCVLGLYYN